MKLSNFNQYEYQIGLACPFSKETRLLGIWYFFSSISNILREFEIRIFGYSILFIYCFVFHSYFWFATFLYRKRSRVGSRRQKPLFRHENDWSEIWLKIYFVSPSSKASFHSALELLRFPWYSVTDDNPIYLYIRLRIRTSQYYICISLLFFVFLLRFHYRMPNTQ